MGYSEDVSGCRGDVGGGSEDVGVVVGMWGGSEDVGL